MRFAVSAPNVGDPTQLVELAVAAERTGWDACFLWDHLQLVRALALDVHDPWVVLGAIAHATSRLSLGALVTPVARRRPWKLAKEITTLDHLSGGRAIVGVGLGWPNDDDFEAFGEQADERARADVYDEGLDLLDRLLRGGPVHADGLTYRVDADMRPAPVQQPRPPIWVAVMVPNTRTLARAARFDGVVPITPDATPMTPDAVAALVARIGRTDDYDVVVPRADGVPAAEYAAAGVTWLVEGTWPEDDWMADLAARVERGPGG